MKGEFVEHVIVVIDADGNEALYVGGILKSCDGPTVYACDIAEAVGEDAIQFSHVPIDKQITDWPDKFEKLLIGVTQHATGS